MDSQFNGVSILQYCISKCLSYKHYLHGGEIIMNSKNRSWLKMSITALLSIVMLSGLLVGCGNTNSAKGANQDTGGTDKATETKSPTTVKTAYAPFIGGIGLYALVDKEIDKAHNINLEIGAFGSTSPLVSVMSGNVDIAFTTIQSYLVSVNALLEEGTSIEDVPKIVYLHNGSTGADGIVADKSIQTIADLKGKSVTAQFGEVTHYMLAKALASEGLSIKDVNMVDMGPGKGGAAFVAGSVDAATTFEPYLSQGTTARDGKIIISTKDMTNTIFDVVVVSAKNAKEKPEWIANTLAAVEDATKYVNDDLDDAAKTTADDLKVSAEEVKEMYPTVYLYTMADNVEAMNSNGWLKGAMEDTLNFYRSIGIVKQAIDVNKLVTTEFLTK